MDKTSDRPVLAHDMLARPDDKAEIERKFASGGFVKAPDITLARLPQKVKLDADLAKRLQKLHDKQAGITQFVNLVTQQGQERIAECSKEGREIYQEIARRHGIDAERVSWNLDNDGVTLVPIGMSLR
jgi:hypothetical protein